MGRGYVCIGLDNPKSTLNIGSVFRAAGCYNVSMIALSGLRASLRIGHCPTDTQKVTRHIPILRVNNLQDVIPFDCVPVAVDLIDEAIPLYAYNHPERAFYIFGAEDATLGEKVLSWCRDIIFIPTKQCMNLAATVNVVLYDRMAKMMTRQLFTDTNDWSL